MPFLMKINQNCNGFVDWNFYPKKSDLDLYTDPIPIHRTKRVTQPHIGFHISATRWLEHKPLIHMLCETDSKEGPKSWSYSAWSLYCI